MHDGLIAFGGVLVSDLAMGGGVRPNFPAGVKQLARLAPGHKRLFDDAFGQSAYSRRTALRGRLQAARNGKTGGRHGKFLQDRHCHRGRIQPAVIKVQGDGSFR